MAPLPDVTARFVPPAITPGPLVTAKLTAPVPDPPVADSPLVVPYACGLPGLNPSAACGSRRYSNAPAAAVSPWLVETTRTSPAPTAPAPPAVTTTCVALWL